MKQTKGIPWSFASIWNDSLLTFDTRLKPEPRDYIYASELGMSFTDRYYKMLGTKYSNPPNSRSLRKFQAGNIWEWIVGFVLKRAGLQNEFQTKFRHRLPGLLDVSCKVDYVAGGVPDWERAESDIKKLELPDFLQYASMQIIGQLRAKHGNKELEKYILEAKSVSSFVFEKIEKTNTYNPNNGLQTFAYTLESLFPGKIVYVCRDDCRLAEFEVRSTDPEVRKLYEEDVAKMTYYFKKKKVPPREEELLFEEGFWRFRHNWKIEYSVYLTLLYGYKNPEEFRDQYKATAARYNRVFKRCVDCSNLTPANKDVIKEAKKRFKKWDDWIDQAKIAKAKGELSVPAEDEE